MKRNKYNAVKTTVDGVTFSSRKEAQHYILLKRRALLGEITHLELQPAFPIVIDGSQVRYPGSNRPMKYVADFSYFDNGKRVIVDCKGVDTPVSKIKRAITEHVYRVKIEVV